MKQIVLSDDAIEVCIHSLRALDEQSRILLGIGKQTPEESRIIRARLQKALTEVEKGKYTGIEV